MPRPRRFRWVRAQPNSTYFKPRGIPLAALEEVVPDREASLFYRPGDAQDLARQTIALLEDQELRRRMGKRGMEMVKDRFQWPALADEFVALCEGYLERGLSA